MEFKIQEKKGEHHKKYPSEEIEIARKFTQKIYKEFGSFIKAVVMFGSHAKQATHGHAHPTKKSDIDILVITNDVSMALTNEVVEAYKIIMQKHIQKISPKIHLTTLTFTHFWDIVRNGDPLAINILRDGFALLDTGIFDPLQMLLYQGKIRPSWESIWTYQQRAQNSLQNSRWHLVQATIDLYWSVVDAAHAALMKIGEIPPSPSHIADIMDKKMYKTKMIPKKYVTIVRDFHSIAKHILKREIKDIDGVHYDRYYRDAKDFVQVMRKIVEKKD